MGLENRLAEYEKRRQYLSEAKKLMPDFKKLSGKVVKAIQRMTRRKRNPS